MQANSAPRWAPNGIGHFDIAGPHAAALQAFYSEVFGWAVTPRGPGYASIETPPGSANGAIVEAQEASLTIGIVVPELRRALEVAVERGGSVAMPPTDNGYVLKAQVVDPAGNRLTLIQG
jgi:predicted enzyme related to lactoylglutathione lyase